MEKRTFIITKPIDYKQQREKFIAYLQSKQKDVNLGLEIYDNILIQVGEPNEVFQRYDYFHNQLKKINDDLKIRMRLYMEDDGDNALFMFKSIHDEFQLRFYVEFKSIYGDVEKMRIANIAKKIAKQIQAGGGAGISFETTDTECDLKIFAKGDIDNCQFTTSGSLKILQFNAHGYDDGMSNVNGELIFSDIDCSYVFDDAIATIKEEIFQKYRDDEDFIDQLKENGIQFDLYVYEQGSTMYSAGWIRGTLEKNDDLELQFEFEIDSQYSNYNYFCSKVFAKISEIGQNWYKDVFEYIPDDEQQSEIWYEDCQFNYGR